MIVELLEPPPGTETQRGTVEPYRPPAPLAPRNESRYADVVITTVGGTVGPTYARGEIQYKT